MEKKKSFWIKNDKKIQIIHSKFIDFLNDAGFAKVEVNNTDCVLVKESKNTVYEISDHIIVEYVQKYLKKIKEEEVLEIFTAGVSNFVSKSKLRLLRKVDLLNDRDPADSSWFYFENECFEVKVNQIFSRDYADITEKIWKSRIIPRKISWLPRKDYECQFQKFCKNISGNNPERFKSLTTIIGYLLHRYQNLGNARAIILVDELISFDGTANGGTGKSLLLAAIGKCREVVIMDGKQDKSKSWFKNQRIERTTDVVFYDDVRKDYSLEELYSMITTGISVEKKYKNEEYIKPENAPKICVSSNYVVKGTGGSTDIRRRCDFELANHYNEKFKPEDEFNNLFFVDWDDAEWNDFYHFMMQCVQQYLKYGLIIPKPINLKRNQLINETSPDFVSFMETGIIENDKWISKATALELFIEEYRHYGNLTSHQMTKWLKAYAFHSGLKYEDRKAGSKYEFYLKTIEGKEVGNEEEN